MLTNLQALVAAKAAPPTKSHLLFWLTATPARSVASAPPRLDPPPATTSAPEVAAVARHVEAPRLSRDYDDADRMWLGEIQNAVSPQAHRWLLDQMPLELAMMASDEDLRHRPWSGYVHPSAAESKHYDRVASGDPLLRGVPPRVPVMHRRLEALTEVERLMLAQERGY